MTGATGVRLTTNHIELAGRIQERGSLRYTPAGIPVIEFRIVHLSEQVEVSVPRQVECELTCIALGPTALLLQKVPPGVAVTASGFLASRSLKHKTPMLHVSMIEFAEKFE